MEVALADGGEKKQDGTNILSMAVSVGCGLGITTLALVVALLTQPNWSAYVYPGIECPGSGSQDTCNGNSCCPGIAATNGKQFPCPAAERTFTCGANSVEEAQGHLVEALLAHMTRPEKYRFIQGIGWDKYDVLHGYYIGNAGGQQRFGIPSLNMQDNGNGFRNDIITTNAGNGPERRRLLASSDDDSEFDPLKQQVTSFPVGLAIASIFSEADVSRFAVAVGKEFRSKGANVILGPAVNLHRVPRGGRNAEYMAGESPYLGARMVKPYIEGVQSTGVLASIKHFVNNNQEDGRFKSNSIVDQRTQHEVYYPIFEAAVAAGVAAYMCGYNWVNGVQACENEELLVNVLKGKFGFKGWVQSDWWALVSFDAANQGIDQEMPGTDTWNNDVYFTPSNLDTLASDKVDKMVRPQLRMMVKYGLLEPDKNTCLMTKCDGHLYKTVVSTPEAQALSRELATKAVLLMKNDGTLPLKKTAKIALLGSACDQKFDVMAVTKQWDEGTYYFIGGSGRVVAKHPITIYDGLKKKCEEIGCEIVTDFSDDYQVAVGKAAGSEVALICGGTWSTEGRDRTTLSVDQEGYIVNVTAGVTIPKVSLTLTPGTVVMPWVDQVNAVLDLFLPGQYAGTAFAEVLFGDSNPSAKTPVTFPKTEEGTIAPCPINYTKDEKGETIEVLSDCPYTEGILVNHQLEDSKILFPFGHGLSYTTFEYSSLNVATSGSIKEKCPVSSAGQAATVCITANVTNTGGVPGVEVAQLYMNYPPGNGEPTKLLRGFVRTEELEDGASAEVVFPLYERDIQMYDVGSEAWVSPLTPGAYDFLVGSSSRDIRLTGTWTP